MLNRHKWIIESMDLQWRWKRIKREGNGRGMKSIGRMDSILILLFFIIPSIAFPTTNLHKPNPEYRKIEGDIIVSDDDLIQIRDKRGAPDVTNPSKKWPIDQVVSYRIEGAYNSDFIKMIRNAFHFWSDNTCLTYQENGPTTPYIRILKGNDCSSQLGRQAGSENQILNLDNGCNTVGTIVHEIAHSIGFAHTQMRWDRDSYVTINKNNMKPAAIRNFDKMLPQHNNNFGVEYDYSSVMHYDPYGFAMNENIPVIIAKDTNAQSSMGQRERAAFSDIKMINSLYNCAQKCPSPSVKCLNGGIINSKTCYSCICPYMFTGVDCSLRHPGRGFYAKPPCGADLTATVSWQNVKGSFGSPYLQYKENATECFWNFKAPVGKRIQIRLHKSDLFCDSGCNWNGMEVFTRGFVNGGYRFCCPEQYIDKVFESLDNGLSIRVFSSYGTPGIDADYRII